MSSSEIFSLYFCISGKLSNFGFNKVSGWVQEDDGSDYLLFASGAQMIIDNFNPFSEDYSNKNGLTIELDFRTTGLGEDTCYGSAGCFYGSITVY